MIIPTIILKLDYNTGIHSTLTQILDPSDAVILIKSSIENLDREKFITIMVNSRKKIIGIHEVAVGTVDQVIVHPREVFKAAILSNASGIILAHNHPTGDPSPDSIDRKTTKYLKIAGKFLGIDIIDHIIIGYKSYYSFLLRETRSL